jgi:alanine racemase
VNGTGAWHLQIDTGMNRAGIGWRDVGAIATVAGLSPPEGAFTHFHSADLDDGSMEEQERRFRAAIGALSARPPILHVENSPAIARRAGSAWDLVRPGVFLFGVGSGPGAAIEPEPVVHLRARIVEVRTIAAGESVSYAATWRASGPRRIATASIGYADGYRRSLGNRAQALVRGQRVPVAGLVTMDMVMLDVSDAPCEVGDVATLLGRDGAELIFIATTCRDAPRRSHRPRRCGNRRGARRERVR